MRPYFPEHATTDLLLGEADGDAVLRDGVEGLDGVAFGLDGDARLIDAGGLECGGNSVGACGRELEVVGGIACGAIGIAGYDYAGIGVLFEVKYQCVDFGLLGLRNN